MSEKKCVCQKSLSNQTERCPHSAIIQKNGTHLLWYP